MAQPAQKNPILDAPKKKQRTLKASRLQRALRERTHLSLQAQPSATQKEVTAFKAVASSSITFARLAGCNPQGWRMQE
jgi:hypothetical protein